MIKPGDWFHHVRGDKSTLSLIIAVVPDQEYVLILEPGPKIRQLSPIEMQLVAKKKQL